jgi:hypothetical protein
MSDGIDRPDALDRRTDRARLRLPAVGVEIDLVAQRVVGIEEADLDAAGTRVDH